MQEGSLVECLNHKNYWYDLDSGHPHYNGPKYKEITTIDGVRGEDGAKWITFIEYPDIDPVDNERYWFDAKDFREIQPPMSIPESLFNQSTKKVTV